MVNTSERGVPSGIIKAQQGKFEVEPLDFNAQLRFPLNIPIYDRVRADGQVESVLNAVQLPILSAPWDLHTEGVRDEVVALIRTELGLPEPGNGMGPRARREGIRWSEHLEQVLTMLWAGFMCFEQVYEVSPARPGQEDTGLDEIVHLRKLSPRMPQSITSIEVGRDGGLEAVTQVGLDDKDIRIPVDQLVMYTHKREGADWSGRSILRTAYRHWLIKDALIRVDAQAGERNSMGIPVVTYSSDADKEEALKIAQDLRAGATSGVALEESKMSLAIVGVQGATVDLLPKISYHDQQIAKSALAMFLDLGHDNGARSLGETHLKVFLNRLQQVADYIAVTATEHIIRDLVELNFGPDEPYPALTPGNLRASQGISVEELSTLVNSKVIQPDDQLEGFVRSNHGLPQVDKSTTRPGGAQEGGVAIVDASQIARSAPVPAPTAPSATDEHDEKLNGLLGELLSVRERRGKR
ncbi:phage portal protein family protein [Zhihengliuella halotolerans]|uniref:phage portal protein family protein n=1 Tax=Zhihengliuella halotolerans TaxID=370736 RepID=UPI0011AECB47|nr:hypothetical protein [Zhihengliuella halotolerans]